MSFCLFREAFFQWWNDNVFRLSASLAFYTIFSFAPIFLIAVSIAGFVFDEERAGRHIAEQMQFLVGDAGGDVVREVLRGAQELRGDLVALAVGLGTLIVGSTAVFAELQSALNQIWRVQADPSRGRIASLVSARLRSLAIVLSLGFLLLVSLVASAVLAGVEESLDQLLPGVPLLWRILNLLVSFLVITVLFAMIYRYLPDREIAWRDVVVGAIVTATLFTVGKFLIGLYLGRTAFASAYGAAGSFVVLLVWIYYSALISFFGAEFTYVYANREGSRPRPAPHAAEATPERA